MHWGSCCWPPPSRCACWSGEHGPCLLETWSGPSRPSRSCVQVGPQITDVRERSITHAQFVDPSRLQSCPNRGDAFWSGSDQFGCGPIVFAAGVPSSQAQRESGSLTLHTPKGVAAIRRTPVYPDRTARTRLNLAARKELRKPGNAEGAWLLSAFSMSPGFASLGSRSVFSAVPRFSLDHAAKHMENPWWRG